MIKPIQWTTDTLKEVSERYNIPIKDLIKFDNEIKAIHRKMVNETLCDIIKDGTVKRAVLI